MDPLNRKAMEPQLYRELYGSRCFMLWHLLEAVGFTSQSASLVSEIACQVGPVLRSPEEVNQYPYLLHGGNCKPEKLLEVRCSGSVCL